MESGRRCSMCNSPMRLFWALAVLSVAMVTAARRSCETSGSVGHDRRVHVASQAAAAFQPTSFIVPLLDSTLTPAPTSRWYQLWLSIAPSFLVTPPEKFARRKNRVNVKSGQTWLSTYSVSLNEIVTRQYVPSSTATRDLHFLEQSVWMHEPQVMGHFFSGWDHTFSTACCTQRGQNVYPTLRDYHHTYT